MRQVSLGKLVRVAAATTVLGAILVWASPASAIGLTFTTGDLVVERVGDGTATLVNSGNPIFLDEYTPAGTLVGSVSLPTTTTVGGNQAMLESGTATYDGEMTLSGDGHYLVVSGYNPPAGNTTSLTGTTATGTPRVTATIDSNANIDSTTAVTDFASVNNFRSATSASGGVGATFYLSGNTGSPGAGGLSAAADGATTSTNIDNYSGSGEIQDYNGTLYVVSRTKSAGFTVGTFGPPLPTGTATVTPLTGFPTAVQTSGTVQSPDSIFLTKLNPAGTANPDTIYVADDTTSGGEIQKWSLVSGTWMFTGAITASMVRGLTGVVSGSSVTLYGTSSGASSTSGALYSATDSTGFDGTAAGAATTLVASIPTNETFRGIQLAPIPLPSPAVPESPLAVLLPLTAFAVLAGGFLITRRRQAPPRRRD